MEIGNALLIGATLLALGAFACRLLPLPGRPGFRERVSSTMGLTASVAVTMALAAMMWKALETDLTCRYIWAHSSVTMEPIYRVSSIWSAGEGALLLCTWFIGLVLAFEIVAGWRGKRSDVPYRQLYLCTLSALLFVFSLMLVPMGLFDRTSPAELVSAPSGLGMDITLQTPEMVLHAPAIFGAYACLAAMFSASLSHSITGDERWTGHTVFWGRLGWMLLTIGIGLGAVWAYYVIGWGGYWAWDPVETSSLLPWLMVTAFLHTRVRRPSQGEYAVLSPLLGMLSFVGVVFVSFVVRAGGLWSSSVHDYGVSESSSAVSRFVSLLGEDQSVLGTFVLLVVLVLVSAFAAFSASRRAPWSKPQPKGLKLMERVNDADNMLYAVSLIVMTAILALVLLFKNTSSDLTATYTEFNQKMSILFVALMVMMSICLVWRRVGKERMLMLATAIVVSSVSLAVVSYAISWSDPLVAFSLPAYLVATVASATALLDALRRGGLADRLRKAGAQVIHLGAALLLIGFVVSSNLQSYPADGPAVSTAVGGEVEVGGYVVHLTSLEILENMGAYSAEVSQVRAAYVDLYFESDMIAENVPLRILYGFDPVLGYHVIETLPHVRSTLAGDIYLSIEWMSEDVVLIHAKTVPLMWVLWMGVVILNVGIFIRLLSQRHMSVRCAAMPPSGG